MPIGLTAGFMAKGFSTCPALGFSISDPVHNQPLGLPFPCHNYTKSPDSLIREKHISRTSH